MAREDGRNDAGSRNGSRALIEILEDLLGAPVMLEELKVRRGRRRTLRATGRRARAIVKVYASERAPVVAARVAALADGPPEPVVPRLLHVDSERHLVVLSEVPGVPLRDALRNGMTAAGPAELDLGNLWAHVELLGMRVSLDLESVMGAFLDGYATCGPSVDDALLDRCRRLALRRLACIHDEERLLERGDVGATATLPEEAARAPDSPQ